MNMSSKYEILRVEQLTKRFTGMTAVDRVNLSVNKGEIHALIGENGAGRVLCVKCSYVYSIDEGVCILKVKTNFKTPADSIDTGIGMLYQERNLVSFLTQHRTFHWVTNLVIMDLLKTTR